MREWCGLFSQTGSDLYTVSSDLGVYPRAVITNNQDLDNINKQLLAQTRFREIKLNETIWYTLPSKPSVEDYDSIFSKFNNPIITLHGFLRIVPKEMCEKYEIYNLHPGLITKYPSLKGYNPQERAFRENYKTTGCVIHRVIPEVDAGKILLSQGVSIEGLNLHGVYEALHDTALDLWKSFFNAYKILER